MQKKWNSNNEGKNSNKEKMEDPENIIYTDTQMTKRIIWDATYKYNHFWSLYDMEIRRGNQNNLINISGMNRYLAMFYSITRNKYDKFEKELKKENIEKFKKIIEKKNRGYDDYKFVMEFISDFGDKTGITDIVKEREDPGKSFGEFS